MSLFTVCFHTIWILGKTLARICFPCCWARFCCLYLIGFRPLQLWANQTVNFWSLRGLKHRNSCWFILPMGRLCKLRVWLQQAPSWVCFEKCQGSSVTEGEKNEVYFKNLFSEKIWSVVNLRKNIFLGWISYFYFTIVLLKECRIM